MRARQYVQQERAIAAAEVAVCSEERARALVESIRSHVALAKDALIEAWRTRAWVPLGYASWDALCDAEFGVRVQLPQDERRELVGAMRDEGMSTRAIGSAVGVSVGTVHGDLAAGVQNRTPASVIGLDGKTYEPEPAPTRRGIEAEAAREFNARPLQILSHAVERADYLRVAVREMGGPGVLSADITTQLDVMQAANLRNMLLTLGQVCTDVAGVLTPATGLRSVK